MDIELNNCNGMLKYRIEKYKSHNADENYWTNGKLRKRIMEKNLYCGTSQIFHFECVIGMIT